MKKSAVVVACTLGALVTVGWTWTTFGPRPYFFKEFPVGNRRPPAATPFEAARHFYDNPDFPGDSPKPGEIHVKILSQSSERAIVDVMLDGGEGNGGDSTYRIYGRLTIEPQNGLWRVTRYHAAWQGRGRLGWTTRPTL